MQQYFFDIVVSLGQQLTFDEEQSHHILHVMRMKNKDIVRISDGQHHLFYVRLAMDKKTVYGEVLEEIEDHTQTRVKITLVQGLIKGDKWDYLIQKACELGVSKIVPFVSKRSVVKIQEDKKMKKVQRWNKIALEACEQCKRSTLVEVTPPITFHEIHQYRSELNVIAYEDADAVSEKLYRVLENNPHIKEITCVIGSEGGFDNEEVKQLMSEEFYRISLGYRILRAETAALSMIDTIAFYYDMIGDKNDKN